MEQITVTLNREALEQLPPSVLVSLLMGQQPAPEPQIAPLAKETNEMLLSLFPAETIKPPKPKYSNRIWTRKDDLALIYGLSKGHMNHAQLAEQLQRSEAGINMRVWRLKKEGRL
jgi:hypothetical protein